MRPEDNREKALHELLEWAHIAVIGLSNALFLVGSLLFLQKLQAVAIWLFIAGSALLLVGNLIRVASKVLAASAKNQTVHW